MMHGKDYVAQKVCGRMAVEKFEGCRGEWDGKTMWSKNGREILLPEEWRVALPAVALSGEIWAGRGRFAVASNAVRLGHWSDPALCYRVFDAPGKGSWLQRLDVAEEALARCDFAAVVEPVLIQSPDQLWQMTLDILRARGEGVMLWNPANYFRPGRTNDILKVKELPPQAQRWHERMIDTEVLG